MNDPLSQTFGFESVEEEERRRRIRGVFDAVAPRYDLMNDFMSFGIHRLWKRRLARYAESTNARVAVDLAGGTGDVARLISRKKGRAVIVVDPSLAMMREGMKDPDCNWRCVAGEGESLPLLDASTEMLTIAFGIRNMTSLKTALEEIRRVLKPGGLFLCLEFSRPHAWFRPFYDLYSFLVIPRLGALVAGEPSAYGYLVESIRRFPGQEEMKAHLEQAGLERVGYRNLSLGIACIHWGYRPA